MAAPRAADAPERAGPRPPDPASLNASQRARRRRIVAAARTLLEERPYESIQMRDVAVAAGVALGTVYRYFSSKEHLFAAVLVDWAGAFADGVRRGPAAGGSDGERLTAALHRAVTAFEHRSQFYNVVTVLQVATEPHVVELYRDFATGVRTVLAETLEDVPPGLVDDVVTLASAVLDTVLRAWSHGHIPLAEARDRLARSVALVFSPPPRVDPVVHARDT